MGLDMYLYARRCLDSSTVATIAELVPEDRHDYLSRWAHERPGIVAATNAAIAAAGMAALVGGESNHAMFDPDKTSFTLLAVYWRKANAIHAWFVDNVQDGVDDCGEYKVHPEALAGLAIACERALAAYSGGNLAAAAEIMTPRSGFFFGGTEVDEYWAAEIQRTADEIRRVIAAAIFVGGVTFHYQSSW